MKACVYAALLISVLLAQWSTSSAKKVKVGGLDRMDSEPEDDWDKELDEEWESWGKKIKKKLPEKEQMSVEAMIEKLKNKEPYRQGRHLEMVTEGMAGVSDATGNASRGAGRDVLWLSLAMVASLAAAFVYMAATGEAAGYGRYSAPIKPGQRRQYHRWLVGARLAWCLQELPALLWPLLLGMDQGALVWRKTPNFILWGLFVFHYFNRSLVYPFQIVNGKPTELHIMLAALLFCMANGYMQARSLCQLIEYDEAWMLSPQFLLGVALMVLGWCMNFHSDGILRSLRQQKQSATAATVPTGDATGSTGRNRQQQQQQQHNNRYCVPRGGAFDLLRLSCPNYAGEILEWVGFMVACDFSAASSAFAFATAANLVPRAISHHNWYITNLNGYPRDRTAVVPFLL